MIISNNCQGQAKIFDKEIPKVPFIFLRHGSTDWVIEKVSEGFIDYPLNDKGIVEVKAAAKIIQSHFVNPVFYCSVYARTTQTCAIIGDFIKSNDITYVQDIRAREFGDIKSIYSEIIRLVKEKKFEEMEAILPESAENKKDFELRCLNALYTILSSHTENRPIIIVSHDEVFRCFAKYLTNQNLSIKKGGIKLFGYDCDHWFVQNIE